MGLYQDIKTLQSRAESGVRLLKKSILDKQGILLEEDKLSTIPEEIATICALDKSNLPSLDFKNTVLMEIPNFRADYCIYNKHQDLYLIFMDNSSEYIMYKEELSKICTLPLNSDNNPFKFLYNSCKVYTVDRYIFLRIKISDLIYREFYSTDGISWSTNINEIISGYVTLPGTIVSVTDTNVSLLSNVNSNFLSLYEIDFDECVMNINQDYVNNFSPKLLTSSRIIQFSTDNINFTVNSDISDNFITYSHRKSPSKHLKLVLPNDITSNVIRWIDGIRTHKNTALLVGVNSSNTIVGCEIIMQYDEDLSQGISYRIFSMSQTATESTIAVDGGKIEYLNGVYVLYTKNNVYTSADYTNWERCNIPIDINITYGYTNGNTLYIGSYVTDLFKSVVYITTNSIVQSTDVPAGKGFLNREGKLLTGIASNSYNTIFSNGKICNIELSDMTLFVNPSVYNKSEGLMTNLSQIIFHNNAFYFFIMHDMKLQVLYSKDGSCWSNITTINQITLPLDGVGSSRWKIISHEGRLFLLRPGMRIADTYEIITNGESVTLSLGNGAFSNPVLTRLLSIYGTSNTCYLYHTATCIVCGYMDSDILKRLFIIEKYGYTEIDLSSSTSQIIEMEFPSNREDSLVIYESDKIRLFKGFDMYVTTGAIPPINSNFRKSMIYDSYLITLHDSASIVGSCLDVFKISETGILSYIDIQNMRSDIKSTLSKDYLPIGDIYSGTLIIDDYQNRNVSLSLDLNNEFDIVHVEDNHESNSIKFMQSCAGTLFMINSVKRPEIFKVTDVITNMDWTDATFTSDRYLAISKAVNKVYVSTDGNIWNIGSTYGTTAGDKIVYAANACIIVDYSRFGKYYFSDDNGLSWIEKSFTEVLRVQNIEAINGKFYVFAKLLAGDTFNRVYTSADGLTWTAVNISLMEPSILRQGWRDITCNEAGLWVAIGFNSSTVVYSTDSIIWNETVLPYSQRWSSVAYGNGYFLAVAEDSNLGAISEDGITWIETRLPDRRRWISAAYGNGKFVAIASNTRYAAYGSELALTNEAFMPTSRDWRRVIFADNKFVAIAYNSKYGAYSSDGIIWTQFELPVLCDWDYLLYGSGLFIAISADGNNVAMSIDGIIWSIETWDGTKPWRFIDYKNNKFTIFELNSSTYNPTSELTFIGTSDTLKEWISGAYGNGKLVIVSKDGTIVEKETLDTTWHNTKVPVKDWMRFELPSGANWSDSTKGKDKTVVISEGSNIGAYTFDGSEFYLMSLPLSANWISVTYGLGGYVSVSKDGHIAQSIDGVSWKLITPPIAGSWSVITFNVYKYVIIASNSQYGLYSYDGINWLQMDLGTILDYVSVAKHTDHYIAIAKNNIIAKTSTDGITWSNITLPIADNFVDICYYDGTYVILSEMSTNVLVSNDDGVSWSVRNINQSKKWNRIRNYEGKFIILGEDTNIGLYSYDGILWESFEMPSAGNWTSLAFINNKYFAFLANSSFGSYSFDGLKWQRTSSIEEVIYGNGTFIAYDSSADVPEETILTYSYDGMNWNVKTIELDSTINDISYGDGKFVIVTNDNNDFIYESHNALTWLKKFTNHVSTKVAVCHGNSGFVIMEKSSNKALLYEGKFKHKTYDLPISLNQRDIAYLNGKYFLFNQVPFSIYESSDLINWVQTQGLPTNITWNGIQYMCGYVILYGANTSTIMVFDGVLWTSFTLPTISNWISLGSYLNDNIHRPSVISADGKVCYFDGTIWKLLTNPNIPLVDIISGLNYSVAISDTNIYTITNDTVSEYVIDTHLNIGTLKSVLYGNGKFIITTSTAQYLISYDGIVWEPVQTPNGFIIDKLIFDDGIFIGICIDDFRYLAYSADGLEWDLIDIDTMYGVDCKIGINNESIWILSDQSNKLTRMVMNTKVMQLSSAGYLSNSKDDISPQRPRYANGSFKINTANNYQKIQLDFTPSKVIIRSRALNSSGKYHQVILSKTKDLYQNVSNSDQNQNIINLEKSDGIISVSGENQALNQPMIIQNGFAMISTLTDSIYDYYAIS